MTLEERSALASIWNQMVRRRSTGFGRVRMLTVRRNSSLTAAAPRASGRDPAGLVELHAHEFGDAFDFLGHAVKHVRSGHGALVMRDYYELRLMRERSEEHTSELQSR